MPRICGAIVLALAQLAFVPEAAAQSGRTYAFATVGYASFSDDEGGLGGGGVVGGGAGIALTTHLSLEMIVTAAHHERTEPMSAWRGDPLVALARARYSFGSPDSPARIFVGGGFGWMRYPGTFTTTYLSSPDSTPEVISASWVMTGIATEFGAGIDVRLGARSFVRPEGSIVTGGRAADRPAGAPEPSYIMPRASVSLGWRF